jgi:hypothetical protein
LAKNLSDSGFTFVAPAMNANIRNRLSTASFFAAVAAAYALIKCSR